MVGLLAGWVGAELAGNPEGRCSSHGGHPGANSTSAAGNAFDAAGLREVSRSTNLDPESAAAIDDILQAGMRLAEKRMNGVRGPPPTRRDSRAASHRTRGKTTTRPQPQSTKTRSRNIEVNV